MAKRSRDRLPQFVPLLHQTLDCAAWNALGPYARLLYISLKRRARPESNGRVFLGVRDAVQEIGAHRNTAMQAFRDLQRLGFVVPTEVGCLGVEGAGKASTWRLTELGCNGQRPTKEYLAWSPGNDFPVKIGTKHAPGKKQKPGTIDVQSCHNGCDVFGEPVTRDVTSCHNGCDVSAQNGLEPVTMVVPHLASG